MDFLEVIQRCNVGVMKARLNAGFVAEALDEAGRLALMCQDLYGDHSTDRAMNGAVDFAHSTFADEVYQSVLADARIEIGCSHVLRPRMF
jgi:hypothetical protein